MSYPQIMVHQFLLSQSKPDHLVKFIVSAFGYSCWKELGKNPQKDGTTGFIPKSLTIRFIIFLARRSWSSIQISDGGPALKLLRFNRWRHKLLRHIEIEHFELTHFCKFPILAHDKNAGPGNQSESSILKSASIFRWTASWPIGINGVLIPFIAIQSIIRSHLGQSKNCKL